MKKISLEVNYADGHGYLRRRLRATINPDAEVWVMRHTECLAKDEMPGKTDPERVPTKFGRQQAREWGFKHRKVAFSHIVAGPMLRTALTMFEAYYEPRDSIDAVVHLVNGNQLYQPSDPMKAAYLWGLADGPLKKTMKLIDYVNGDECEAMYDLDGEILADLASLPFIGGVTRVVIFNHAVNMSIIALEVARALIPDGPTQEMLGMIATAECAAMSGFIINKDGVTAI